MPDPSDVHDAAARELYGAPPDEFLARRAELATRARQGGDAAGATAIERLRKPTVAAWIVNTLALDDGSIVEQLTELGDRLRAAQDALDAATLRDLSTERRALVARLARQAFALAERRDPPAALRDEVSGTLEAAIADADVATRLGRLARAEQWSGFGFGPSGAPELTLVRGGRDERAQNQPKKPTPPKQTAAQRRQQQRALTGAKERFAAAESAFEQARSDEQRLHERVRQLTKKLAKLQSQLDDARAELETTRKDVTEARTRRREARSALDRAERDAGR